MEYRFRSPLAHPSARGGQPPNPRTVIEDGLRIDWDVAVPMRDGVHILVDIFRPASAAATVPPIVAWGPYGKHGHTVYEQSFPHADVDGSVLSKYTAFEAPDPVFWAQHGYAVVNVDPRGTWYSEGRATYLSPDEARDFYDLIEWLAVQPWSNGKVGLSGVSYLTSSQWFVASLNPPHLAAINPWEGWSDTYREVVRHGGIPETSFWPYLPGRWGHGLHEVEDLARETAEHPFYDAFWQSKSAELDRIRVPAYVVVGWADQGLHCRGTLEGYRRMASEHKWLELHGSKKWKHYYEAESRQRRLAFFDRFLKGRADALDDWPAVRMEIREGVGVGTVVHEPAWPIARTEYRVLHLDAAHGALVAEKPAQAAQCDYMSQPDLPGPKRATFDLVFDEDTDVIGHMALHLWASMAAGEDMDVFVGVQKLDRNGQVVPFIYYAQFEDGPVALGWIRASHRELDTDQSMRHRPVLAHRRALPVTPGEPMALDIEIWPSATAFKAGEGLRLVVQGSDLYDYPKPSVYARHEERINRGEHTLHTGGRFDAHLLLPVVARR